MQILDSGVTIHTVAITNAADTVLESVAHASGGHSFVTSDSDSSNAITEAFQAIGRLIIAGLYVHKQYTLLLWHIKSVIPGAEKCCSRGRSVSYYINSTTHFGLVLFQRPKCVVL